MAMVGNAKLIALASKSDAERTALPSRYVLPGRQSNDMSCATLNDDIMLQ